MLKLAYQLGVQLAAEEAGLTKEAGAIGSGLGAAKAGIYGGGIGSLIGALTADNPAEGTLKGLGIGAGIGVGGSLGGRALVGLGEKLNLAARARGAKGDQIYDILAAMGGAGAGATAGGLIGSKFTD